MIIYLLYYINGLINCMTDRFIIYIHIFADGMEMVNPKRYRIHPNVTEVGCERPNQPPSNAQCLQLSGPNIQPRHCVIAHTEGIVTVTPCSRDAETYVGGQRIFETTILQVSVVYLVSMRILYLQWWPMCDQYVVTRMVLDE